MSEPEKEKWKAIWNDHIVRVTYRDTDQMNFVYYANYLKYLEEGLFQAGEYIFQKGDDPLHIYIVKKGKVDLLITDQEVILKKKTLVAGDCFGEASLMAMHRHTATAVALEESTVMILSRRALLRFRKEDTELFSLLMMNIARELARRLELTDEILLHYIKTRKNRVKNPQTL